MARAISDRSRRVSLDVGSSPPTRGTRVREVASAILVVLLPLGCVQSERPGRDVGPAERIVSLIPAATEIVFALGAGDRLVGRTRWGLHPPEAASVPDVGDGVRPSLEVVLARDPDLVVLFAGQDTEGVSERLARSGVRTLPLVHNSLDDLYRNIATLGDVVGCATSAARLTRHIEDEVELVRTAVAGRAPIRVYYDVWTDPPMTIGRGSYLDTLITIAGGKNVFADLDTPSPEVGLEAIVHRDPDIVVHGRSAAPGAASDPPQNRPAWQVVSAVREGRVAVVDADLLGRLGPRIADAAAELARALHPGAPVPEAASRTPGTCIP